MAFESDFIRLINIDEALINDIICKIFILISEKLFNRFFGSYFSNFQKKIDVTTQKLILILFCFLDNIVPPYISEKFLDGLQQERWDLLINKESHHIEEMFALILLVLQKIKI